MDFDPKSAFQSREVSYSYQGEEFADPRILVVGCGDAGCRMVTRLSNLGVSGAETLAVNTDQRWMGEIKADGKILIGRGVVVGDGAGGDPEVGRIAAKRSERALLEALGRRDLVFVAAGLGGGTGAGAAPLICRMAKDLGATAVGIFTLPLASVFQEGVEGATIDIEDLVKATNTSIILDNNKILEMAPDLSAEQTFSVMDQVVAEIIKGIVETITQTSLINLDYADVRTIMADGGLSAVLVGEADSGEGAEVVVLSALRSPMLEVETKAATGCLLHITGGEDLTLKKAAEIAGALTRELDERANVIWGARVKAGRGGRIGLLAIMTGVGTPRDPGRSEALSSCGGLRTASRS
ncbi:cell division protein FtsZ [Methanocrinis sp.]|uniref:cell division protein FtsZ n=1 Tax=Methanocrinis sp. TaxID=3101522 RepID=UPI003D0DEFA5